MMKIYSVNLKSLLIIPFVLEGQQNSLLKLKKKHVIDESRKTPIGAILFFKMRQKVFPGKIC